MPSWLICQKRSHQRAERASTYFEWLFMQPFGNPQQNLVPAVIRLKAREKASRMETESSTSIHAPRLPHGEPFLGGLPLDVDPEPAANFVPPAHILLRSTASTLSVRSDEGLGWYAERHPRDGNYLGPDATVEITITPK